MRLHGGQALGVTRDLSSWFNPGLASRLPLLLPVFHSWFPPLDTRWEAGFVALGECFLLSVIHNCYQQEVRP